MNTTPQPVISADLSRDQRMVHLVVHEDSARVRLAFELSPAHARQLAHLLDLADQAEPPS